MANVLEVSKEPNFTEKELKDGKLVVFENEDHYLELEYREMYCGRKKFTVWLNMKYISITVTYKPFEKKANELIERYNLKRSEKTYLD